MLNLAKCMHVMCDMTAKLQDGYKNNQCMWILHINDAWKNQIFEKTEQFNAETPQSIVFHEWNAWVWD